MLSIRWCKLPGLCYRDVIRQSAYCYIEGSFCQKWIRRKIRENYEDISNGNIMKNDLVLVVF